MLWREILDGSGGIVSWGGTSLLCGREGGDVRSA